MRVGMVAAAERDVLAAGEESRSREELGYYPSDGLHDGDSKMEEEMRIRLRNFLMMAEGERFVEEDAQDDASSPPYHPELAPFSKRPRFLRFRRASDPNYCHHSQQIVLPNNQQSPNNLFPIDFPSFPQRISDTKLSALLPNKRPFFGTAAVLAMTICICIARSFMFSTKYQNSARTSDGIEAIGPGGAQMIQNYASTKPLTAYNKSSDCAPAVPQELLMAIDMFPLLFQQMATQLVHWHKVVSPELSAHPTLGQFLAISTVNRACESPTASDSICIMHRYIGADNRHPLHLDDSDDPKATDQMAFRFNLIVETSPQTEAAHVEAQEQDPQTTQDEVNETQGMNALTDAAGLTFTFGEESSDEREIEPFDEIPSCYFPEIGSLFIVKSDQCLAPARFLASKLAPSLQQDTEKTTTFEEIQTFSEMTSLKKMEEKSAQSTGSKFSIDPLVCMVYRLAGPVTAIFVACCMLLNSSHAGKRFVSALVTRIAHRWSAASGEAPQSVKKQSKSSEVNRVSTPISSRKYQSTVDTLPGATITETDSSSTALGSYTKYVESPGSDDLKMVKPLRRSTRIRNLGFSPPLAHKQCVAKERKQTRSLVVRER